MSNQIGKCIYPLAVRADGHVGTGCLADDCQHFLDAVGNPAKFQHHVVGDSFSSKKLARVYFSAAHVLIINMHQAAAVDLQSRLPVAVFHFHIESPESSF